MGYSQANREEDGLRERRVPKARSSLGRTQSALLVIAEIRTQTPIFIPFWETVLILPLSL